MLSGFGARRGPFDVHDVHDQHIQPIRIRLRSVSAPAHRQWGQEHVHNMVRCTPASRKMTIGQKTDDLSTMAFRRLKDLFACSAPGFGPVDDTSW